MSAFLQTYIVICYILVTSIILSNNSSNSVNMPYNMDGIVWVSLLTALEKSLFRKPQKHLNKTVWNVLGLGALQ